MLTPRSDCSIMMEETRNSKEQQQFEEETYASLLRYRSDRLGVGLGLSGSGYVCTLNQTKSLILFPKIDLEDARLTRRGYVQTHRYVQR